VNGLLTDCYHSLYGYLFGNVSAGKITFLTPLIISTDSKIDRVCRLAFVKMAEVPQLDSAISLTRWFRKDDIREAGQSS